MNSILIISKSNMKTNREYYSHILTAFCMKLKLKMSMTNLLIKKCLILVIILLSQNITMIQTH